MAYTTIDNPELYFQVKTYTGNGGTLAITLDGSEDMSPNFVWIKERNSTSSHALTDTVRGNTKKLKSDGNDAEETNTNLITSFDSDGFTLGNNGNANQSSSQTYVAWNWKAGTSFSNSAGANGASIASTGSVNATAGFSIISYTGSGSNATVAHGLGSVPKMIIVKSRSGAVNWQVYHSSIANTEALELNGSGPKYTAANRWNSTSTTSSVFSIGTSTETNASSATFIAYCFAEKQGYSKFGSYTGNGNANGPFVYTGFKPAFTLIKKSSADGSWWEMVDNKRSPSNVMDNTLYANVYNTEFESSAYNRDFLSNGFKLRNTNAGDNTSGATYIYMAFAENPFTTSSGVPGTAR